MVGLKKRKAIFDASKPRDVHCEWLTRIITLQTKIRTDTNPKYALSETNIPTVGNFL